MNVHGYRVCNCFTRGMSMHQAASCHFAHCSVPVWSASVSSRLITFETATVTSAAHLPNAVQPELQLKWLTAASEVSTDIMTISLSFSLAPFNARCSHVEAPPALLAVLVHISQVDAHALLAGYGAYVQHPRGWIVALRDLGHTLYALKVPATQRIDQSCRRIDFCVSSC